jgi:hypothetical protein
VGEVVGDGERTALWRELDYFPTPPWAARAGGEVLALLDPQARSVWEPACGEGHMAAALGERFVVFGSDIHPFGYGAPYDFLAEAGPDYAVQDDGFYADWIVTNPPFRTAAEFLRLGLTRARRGVALLLRLAFLEGTARYRLLHGPQPLTLCCPFAERVPMTLGRWDPAASSATAYAWFFWMKGAAPQPLRGIPPGSKARLSTAEDAHRFGWRSERGLLDRMEAGK